MRKTVLVSISRGFVVRDLMISGAIQSLLGHPVKIVLLTHEKHLEDVRSYVNGMKDAEVHPYPPMPLEVGKVERKLINAGYKLERFAFCVNLLARLNGLYFKAFPSYFFQSIFDRYHPDLVLCGSPGYHSPMDSRMIREANRRGIPTLSIVPSWDNLFTRGILPAFPNRLTVWNEQIKSDFIQVYGLSPEQIEVTGPLQFDFYFDESLYVSRSEFFQKNGLDENKKLVTIALSRTDIYGNPEHFLSAIEKVYLQGAFDDPIQFVCRLHPFEPQITKESLNHHRIFHLEHFNEKSASFGWCPDWEEIRHKANLLKHSDVIINYYSTFGIEGALVGTPVIQIEFGHENPEKFEQFRSRVYKRHYRYLKDTTAIRTVRSEQELIHWLNRYLRNPEDDAKARRELSEYFCFKLDGKAHERLGQLAKKMLFNSRNGH